MRRFGWHDSGPGAGLMASHTLPAGLECHYEWASYPDHPRVVVQRTNERQQWNADYWLPDNPEDEGQTIVTDHLGRKQVWQWNSPRPNHRLHRRHRPQQQARMERRQPTHRLHLAQRRYLEIRI